MKTNIKKIKSLSADEQKLRTLKIWTVLNFPNQEAKPRDPEKTKLLKKFEEKRDGFKIGKI